MRLTISAAKKKLEYLDIRPWLLARADTVDVAKRAVELWGLALPSDHHPLTCELLAPGTLCRLQVDVFIATGQIGNTLRASIDMIRNIPFDDSHGEGPHAHLSRASSNTRRSSWCWNASTARQAQHFIDIEAIPPPVSANTQAVWNAWSSVTRRTGKSRCVRKQAKLVESCVYQVLSADGFRADLADDVMIDRDDEGDDCVMLDAPDHDGEVDVDAAAARALRDVLTNDDQSMLTGYLEATLKVYSYYTVVNNGELYAFQVLQKRKRMITVETFVSKRDKCKKAQSWEWSIQPVSIWRAAVLPADPKELHAFVLEDAAWTDMLTMGGVSLGQRHAWREWHRNGTPDVHGTFRLESQGVPRPPWPMSDSRTPVISLVDALAAKGYMGRPARLIHNGREGLFYDRRNLASKQKYLMCVLARDDIIKKGNHSFSSDQPTSFYDLLLRSPGKVAVPKKKAAGKACTKAAKDLEAKTAVKTPALDVQAPLPVASAIGKDEVDGSDDDGPFRPAPAMPPPLPAPPPPAMELGLGGSSPVDPIDAGGVDLPGDAGDGIDGGSDGEELSIVQVEGVYLRPEGNSRLERGYRVQCPYHANCGRPWRAVSKDQHIFGPNSAKYFLGCWLKRGITMSVAEHKPFRPSRADVQEYVAELDAMPAD